MAHLNPILHFILEQRYQEKLLSEQFRVPEIEIPVWPKMPSGTRLPSERLPSGRSPEEPEIFTGRIETPTPKIELTNPEDLMTVLKSDLESAVSSNGSKDPEELSTILLSKHYDNLMQLNPQQRHDVINDFIGQTNQRLGRIPKPSPIEVEPQPAPKEIVFGKPKSQVTVADAPMPYTPPALPQTQATSQAISYTGVEPALAEPKPESTPLLAAVPVAQALLQRIKPGQTKKTATKTIPPKEEEEDYGYSSDNVDVSMPSVRKYEQDDSGTFDTSKVDIEPGRKLGKYASTYHLK
jgi:hypothetical protein